ncbi:MAG: hypothetical protein WCN95_07595 [bacterium]
MTCVTADAGRPSPIITAMARGTLQNILLRWNTMECCTLSIQPNLTSLVRRYTAVAIVTGCRSDPVRAVKAVALVAHRTIRTQAAVRNRTVRPALALRDHCAGGPEMALVTAYPGRTAIIVTAVACCALRNILLSRNTVESCTLPVQPGLTRRMRRRARSMAVMARRRSVSVGAVGIVTIVADHAVRTQRTMRNAAVAPARTGRNQRACRAEMARIATHSRSSAVIVGPVTRRTLGRILFCSDTVVSRTLLVQPCLPEWMRRRPVAGMAIVACRRWQTGFAIQVVTIIADRTLRLELAVGSCPVGPG